MLNLLLFIFILFDIFMQNQNELCNITDATHFILVNCNVIIKRDVISYCKKKQISLLNIHPGDINCPGRQTFVKSQQSHIYGVFCHEVTSIIDDTRNVLYSYSLHTECEQTGLEFIKNKTEYILRELR